MFATVMSTEPGVSAGTTAEMELFELTVKLVAGTLPNMTLDAPLKFCPRIVIVWPPAEEPELDETPVTIGGIMPIVKAI